MSVQIKFLIGIIILFATVCLHLFAGSTSISLAEFLNALFHYDQSNTHHIIARDLRFPRMVMGIIAGSGLSLAGLLTQTIFKNPLAEPNILGVTTGASLFVALTLLTGSTFFLSDTGIITSALTGAFTFGIIILLFAKFIRSHSSLLLVGIMLGSFTASFISIIQSWSNAQQLKTYTMWALGSLQQISFSQLPIVSLVFLLGIFASFFLIRNLNALVLGSENANLLGVQIVRTRIITIAVISILSGLITAFCGPIAFIGMAVPNIVKIIFQTQKHSILIIGSILFGAIFLLLCDSIVQLLSDQLLLPINALTSLIGAPFVIYVIIKRWS